MCVDCCSLGSNRIPMAKRLRGWKLEKESNRVPVPKTTKPLEKGTELESALATRLLALWAHGVLSTVMIRDLADRALQDGAKHPELLQIAACANWGAHQGNAHRVIMTSFCKQVDFAEATEVTVACIDP